MGSSYQDIEFTRYSGGTAEECRKGIAVEKEVALSVNGEAWLGLHCSPDHLEALAAGFLYNEFFIDTKEEIVSITICGQGELIDVWLQHAVKKPDVWSRTSGCLGGVNLPEQNSVLSPVEPKSIPISDIVHLVDSFYAVLTDKGKKHSGLHTTALSDGSEMVVFSRDIGRRNTLDKIAGECLLNQIKLVSPALVTTGRLSADMVQKAARIRAGLVISLHSATTMAIQTAHRLGVTLVGRAHPSQMDIYSHKERIIF